MSDGEVERSLAANLFDVTKNLQRYIHERAEEIAAPRIAAAEEQARAKVAGLAAAHELEQQRWGDLVDELRRHIKALDSATGRYARWLRENNINPLTGLKETHDDHT